MSTPGFNEIISYQIPTSQFFIRLSLVSLQIDFGSNVAPALTKQGMLYVLAGERIVRELRKEVFQALLRQEVAYFDVQTTGAPWPNLRCWRSSM